MKVYLVEDCENAPGRIYAVFASEEDATEFADLLPMATDVTERKLWYGQPSNCGMNE